MYHIRHLFSAFLSRFTYRQRFIFFALVYIVSMPAPSFWMIQTQEVLLEAITLQRQGNQIQKSFNSLLSHLLQHQIASLSQKPIRDNQTLSQLKDLIGEDFKNLFHLLQEGLIDPPSPLAGGFSNYPEQKIPLEDIHNDWLSFIKDQDRLPIQERIKRHQKISEQITFLLNEFGFSFGLYLTTDPIASILAEYTLNEVPEKEALITKVTSLKSIPQDKNGQLQVEINALLIALKRQFQSRQILLESLYQERKGAYGVPYSEFLELDHLRDKAQESLKDLSRLLAYPSFAEQEQALKILEIYHEISQKSSQILGEIIQTKWIQLSSQKWFSIILLVACTIFVSSLVMFRILTKHLQKVYDHIRDLSKGKFTLCFCSNSTDDFGEVGKAFDHLSLKMEEVIGELQMLGKLLSGFTHQINHTANEQESTVIQQEGSLKKIEGTAREMIDKAKHLAHEMDDLSQAAKKTALADTAKIKLNKMQEKMTDLRHASTKIVDKLTFIQDKVNKTSFLIDFMIVVSDQTKLLSINAAIETANIEHHKYTFSEITQHIERFSDLTAASTNSIKIIIQEMSTAVSNTRNEANRCLKEINEGASHLITVSHQLTSIDKQREDQVKKFQAVNISMQEQALAGETMLNSITKLGNSAEENIKSLKNLHMTISEIGSTAKELQKVLDRFSLKPAA